MKNFWKFVCFCFVGGTATLIYMIIFNLFFWIGLNFIFSWALALIIALTYHFLINKRVTFSQREGLKKQIPRYMVVYILSTLINFTIIIIIRSILGEGILQANIAIFAGIIISIPFNFFGSLLWVFKKNENLPN